MKFNKGDLMQIICLKENLVTNTNIVLKAISQRTTLPILECILLEVSDIFKMTANNLEMAIETAPIEVDIVRPGRAAIDAKMFFDIIRRLPEDKVIIKVEDNDIVYITSGKAEFKIFGQDADDFPRLPDFEKLEKYTVGANAFRNMIRQTIFSISSLDDKPVYTGELMEIEEGVLNLVAVDNFRVSLRKETLSESGSNFMAIIPGRTMNELSKILPQEGDVSFYFTEKHVLFESEGCMLISRLIEGEFLKYKQVLSQDHTTSLDINAKELLSALERSTLISGDNRKTPVILKMSNNRLAMTSKAEMGNLYDELDIQMMGRDLQISFNPKYLIDAIKVIESETITLGFNSELSPCIITEKGLGTYKYLVLPLRPN